MDRPTPEAVRAVLARHGLTGERAARMMYLSGSRQVRKYLAGEREMDLARWFTLHAHLILDEDTIAAIEASMG